MTTALTKTGRSASADVLIVPVTSQVTLDQRFQTTNVSQATTANAQRLALIGLASSQAVAERVTQELGTAQADGASDVAQTLLGKVTVAATSDLLRITVSAAEPAQAKQIAEAWGKAYERLVTELYTRSQSRSDLLDEELLAAQQRYMVAQQSLEAFLSDTQLITAQRQIDQLTNLLNSSREAQQQLYTNYLSRTRELDLILIDAQTLRDQVDAQGVSGFAEELSALILRARAVDSAAPTFQLSASDLRADQATTANKPAELVQLIAVLARRRTQLLAQANDLAQAIASGESSATGLDTTSEQRYVAQLSSLKGALEQLQARQAILTQERDLARDTLILVQKKRYEQELARSSPQMEVRFISASINPAPSQIVNITLRGAAAAAIGLALGMILALLLDIFVPALRRLSLPEPTQPAARPDTPADRPIPGD